MNMFFKNKMSEDSPTIEAINNTIKNIGYIALCISILLFLIIKILKYLLARRAMALQQQKFKLNLENSQNNTPSSLTPILKEASQTL